LTLTFIFVIFKNLDIRAFTLISCLSFLLPLVIKFQSPILPYIVFQEFFIFCGFLYLGVSTRHDCKKLYRYSFVTSFFLFSFSWIMEL
jgi:hypothetical protein